MAVFKQAPGAESAGQGASEAGAGLEALGSMDQILAIYWPVLLGLALALALVAIGRREASVFAAGLAVLLQATLVLSTQ